MARLTSEGPNSSDPRLFPEDIDKLPDEEVQMWMDRLRGARSMVPKGGKGGRGGTAVQQTQVANEDNAI